MKIKINTWFQDHEYEDNVYLPDNLFKDEITKLASDNAIDLLFIHGAG